MTDNDPLLSPTACHRPAPSSSGSPGPRLSILKIFPLPSFPASNSWNDPAIMQSDSTSAIAASRFRSTLQDSQLHGLSAKYTAPSNLSDSFSDLLAKSIHSGPHTHAWSRTEAYNLMPHRDIGGFLIIAKFRLADGSLSAPLFCITGPPVVAPPTSIGSSNSLFPSASMPPDTQLATQVPLSTQRSAWPSRSPLNLAPPSLP
ncbi:hypothetical protein SEMRO_422_G139660.1 [Seminavis robusta]|uniref:Uncharacterized protein n=1 Tax=Seminavis robusta TaxID=568900 RepID=A0A9N8DW87_9STRA|nr:hypothetical protein SEMRO_422_G139660.1 [Seminavis robusta]|eukprot:Sro422_g139660.1 n/a (202) ;mRNA; f:26824-27429